MLEGQPGGTPCSAVQGQMTHLCLCSCVYASCVFSSWNAYRSPFSSCVLTSCSSLFACYLCRCCCCWSLCWGCCITLNHNSISSCQLVTTSKSADQHGTVCYLRDRFVFRFDCFAAACSPFLPTAHCTVYTRRYKAKPAIHASQDLVCLCRDHCQHCYHPRCLCMLQLYLRQPLHCPQQLPFLTFQMPPLNTRF